MKDPGNLDISMAALDVGTSEEKMRERKNRNMVRISNTEVIENLGQVDCCICDKTGTLTTNLLTLKKIYVDGLTFDIKPMLSDASTAQHQFAGKISNESVIMIKKHLESASSKNGTNLFLCLALCHTAIVSTKKGSKIGEFIGESEDELTLLSAAKQIGFRFYKRETDAVYLKIFGEEAVFKLIGLLPFDSVRKRMSVVVQNTLTNDTLLFCKGADSEVLSKCQNLSEEKSKKILQKSDKFANLSYRTMAMAMRVMDPQLVRKFSQYLRDKEQEMVRGEGQGGAGNIYFGAN